MEEYRFEIYQVLVYDEVAKTTAYIGDKMGEEHSYELIATTEENQEMLLAFWEESKVAVEQGLKDFLYHAGESNGVYSLELSLSNLFNEGFTDSIQNGLFYFFVSNITSKWLSFMNKDEASTYAADAATLLDDVRQKAYFKQRPTRPTYTD